MVAGPDAAGGPHLANALARYANGAGQLTVALRPIHFVPYLARLFAWVSRPFIRILEYIRPRPHCVVRAIPELGDFPKFHPRLKPRECREPPVARGGMLESCRPPDIISRGNFPFWGIWRHRSPHRAGPKAARGPHLTDALVRYTHRAGELNVRLLPVHMIPSFGAWAPAMAAQVWKWVAEQCRP